MLGFAEIACNRKINPTGVSFTAAEGIPAGLVGGRRTGGGRMRSAVGCERDSDVVLTLLIVSKIHISSKFETRELELERGKVVHHFVETRTHI